MFEIKTYQLADYFVQQNKHKNTSKRHRKTFFAKQDYPGFRFQHVLL